MGSEGTADCNLLNKNLTLSRTDPDSGKLLISTIDDESLFDLDATYKDELKSFINTINRGSKPEISLHDGLQVLDLLKGQNV